MGTLIDAACGCNTGLRRSNNEDNFIFHQRSLPLENNGLENRVLSLQTEVSKNMIFGVFDGMGGENHGEEAAFLAAEIAKEDKQSFFARFSKPEDHLRDLVNQMNTEVCKSMTEHGTGRMGSTVVMAQLNIATLAFLFPTYFFDGNKKYVGIRQSFGIKNCIIYVIVLAMQSLIFLLYSLTMMSVDNADMVFNVSMLAGFVVILIMAVLSAKKMEN